MRNIRETHIYVYIYNITQTRTHTYVYIYIFIYMLIFYTRYWQWESSISSHSDLLNDLARKWRDIFGNGKTEWKEVCMNDVIKVNLVHWMHFPCQSLFRSNEKVLTAQYHVSTKSNTCKLRDLTIRTPAETVYVSLD